MISKEDIPNVPSLPAFFRNSDWLQDVLGQLKESPQNLLLNSLGAAFAGEKVAKELAEWLKENLPVQGETTQVSGSRSYTGQLDPLRNPLGLGKSVDVNGMRSVGDFIDGNFNRGLVVSQGTWELFSIGNDINEGGQEIGLWRGRGGVVLGVRGYINKESDSRRGYAKGARDTGHLLGRWHGGDWYKADFPDLPSKSDELFHFDERGELVR